MSKVLFGLAVIPSTIAGFLVYNHFYLPKYVGNEDLKGKLAIITGGSSGIGHELARRLALRNVTLVLACKDMYKCHAIREEISETTGNKNIFCSQLNLESTASINNFVKRISEKFKKIDILVNSAGYKSGANLEITDEFMEKNLAVNAVGPHLLIKGFLPLLTASESARVLYLICPIYAYARIFENDINFIDASKDKIIGVLAFSQSQLMRFLSMRHFADQYKSLNITFNACDPGRTNTNFYNKQNAHNYKIIQAFKLFIYRNVSIAAETPEMCCVSEDLNGITGMLYKDMKPVQYAPQVVDPELMKRAMSVFNQLTHDETEIPI